MKGVLALLSTLLISLRLQYVAADCNNNKPYNTTFIPACDPKDMRVNWPDYENQKAYYKCYAPNNAVRIDCPNNLYFCFALQSCGSCSQYIPPVECSKLPTEKEPNCGNITNSTPTPGPGDTTTPTVTTGIPTPNYPSTTTSTTTTTTIAPNTTTTSTTVAPTTTTSTTTTTTTTAAPPTAPTPPTPGTGSPTDIPPISYPTTLDPGVPMPPTPDPTPPNVSIAPPTVPPSPGS